jgi:light-regulated signal transduction histidine kinase (bacteriophytochrome)
MNEMIEALLELAKVGRDTLCISKVDLGGMAAEVIQQLRDAQPSRQVEVDLAGNTIAMGDPRLLRSVLDNLLGNAWKFTGKTANARITFGSMVKDGVAVFYVRDNGAGFDPTYARKLFGVFQRLHSSHEFEGTGVGLATVQRIIERHGGRIWAESSKGQGATFYFTLPGPRERQLVKESALESSLAKLP